MRVEVPYGQTHITVDLDPDRIAGIIYPNEVATHDESDVLTQALENPLGKPSFSEYMQEPGKTIVIVNDGTRPTPTSKVISHLADYLVKGDSEFIIATGVHRAPTEDEYQLIFGEHYSTLAAENRIIVHDANNDDDMTFIGTSKNGTEMWVNKRVLEASKIIIIGSVEPHYFAGYTGGRKSFLPGLASYKTISMNHKYALDPRARSLQLRGNPVHEDMIDAIRVLENTSIFSIQIVLDRNRRIYAASAGDIFASMEAAIASANEVYAVNINRKEDIVVSVAPFPMDVDLYQSQKALDNGKLALNDGGILIIVSKCRSGIGPDTFYQLMSSCESPEEVLSKIEQGYILGYHKAAKMVEVGLWAEIWAVTGLDPQIMRKIFIQPYPSLQNALDKAFQIKGPASKVLFLMEGSVTVPLLQQTD
ncbi:nickel-dependent lactate racemase [bacterium]|nr:nickel-dependent lactate racemase [candidate division CSSED10-310 bacterium]